MLAIHPSQRQKRTVEIKLLSKDGLDSVNRAEQLIADLASSKNITAGAITVAHSKSQRRQNSRSGSGGGSTAGRGAAPPRAQRRPTLDNKRRDSMLAARGRDSRRERTFVGGACAVCEEPLEHTLRGERILQLACGHVAHQACFYEFMRELEGAECPTCNAPIGLDPSRGAATDFDNLHRMIRNATTPSLREREWDQSTTQREEEWEPESVRNVPAPQPATKTQSRHGRDYTISSQSQTARDWRKEEKVAQSTAGSGDAGTETVRRREYDAQSETSTASPRYVRNPIPPPTVTVRSEYPTLSKSKQQQSLTCLVTIEVPSGKWSPTPSDLQHTHRSNSNRSPRKTQTPIPRSQPIPTLKIDTGSDAKRLNDLKDDLFARVDNWHGLDFSRFGKLHLHSTMRVGKDKQSWQELECFLFTQMLICVKEKKNASQEWSQPGIPKPQNKFALKGSILIKRHLQDVEYVPEQQLLSLSLSVVELPFFHLQFKDASQLEIWRKALTSVERVDHAEDGDIDHDPSGTDEENDPRGHRRRLSTLRSSSQGGRDRSPTTAPTEYTNSRVSRQSSPPNASSLHVPLDIVVVVPVSGTMHGLKNNLLRDALRFMIANLGDRDRLALVTFGSETGGVPLVGMTGKGWTGWSTALERINPEVSKNQRADVVDGANVAMDLLMQRKSSNPLSSIILISDSAISDVESVDFVVSRAEAAKITIHSFGLGLTHKPDTMVELSTRTKGAYTFVKDWMMLRECLAGCMGSLQTTSHQNVKLKLHLPEGSTAKFMKISGALQITKRATGRDAEACLGDLRFGDKRDILVQLTIPPDDTITDTAASDPWESIISNLEALGGTADSEELRGFSIEEMPLLQADLSWGDLLQGGNLAQLPRQSLLAITMLPHHKKGAQPMTPPIPPHPSVVQRRMELLTSDMLGRALTLVSRNQHDRASHLLAETRSILQGLGKGSLPPLPPNPRNSKVPSSRAETPSPTATDTPLPDSRRTPTPPRNDRLNVFAPGAGIDQAIIAALDKDLENSLEFILHPTVFNRDSRKTVLQEIGVISSQRGLSFRTPAEGLWASRVAGVQRLLERSREWRDIAELPANRSD